MLQSLPQQIHLSFDENKATPCVDCHTRRYFLTTDLSISENKNCLPGKTLKSK